MRPSVHDKPKKAEQELAGLAPGGQAPPGADDGFLGHFLEPDDMSDQKDMVHVALGIGIARKMAILRAIFARCTQQGSCLVWTGPHSGTGRGGSYGRFSFEGRTTAVHRTVYEVVYGPIPGHKQVDHSCKNRLCCNPKHLRHMTHKQNQKLRDERNRDGDCI